MEETKISVVVPVFNVELYIDKCIESILSQTYKNFELILVNDGSTDSSYQHILKYKDNNQIVIINKANSGQSDSRYQGLLRSSGEYIYFVDSDDYIEPNTLEILVNDIIKYQSDVVFGRYRLVDEAGKVLRTQSNYNVQKLIGTESIVQDAVRIDNFKSSLCLKLIRKEILMESFSENAKNIHVNEDVLLSILISTKCSVATFQNEIIYNILQRNGSLTRNLKPELITVNDQIYSEIKNKLVDLSLFSSMDKDYYSSYIKSVVYALGVVGTRSDSFRSFMKMYDNLSKCALYNSTELKNKLRYIPLKFRLFYHLSLIPRLYYISMKTCRSFLQY